MMQKKIKTILPIALSIVVLALVVMAFWPSEIKKNWFREEAFQKLLDEKTLSRAHDGNQVRLLVNGLNSMKQREANIANADVIFIKTFEFWNDEAGTKILSLLADRAKKGAKVFIQFDVKGTFMGVDPDHFNKIQNGKVSPVPEYLQQFVNESQGNGFVIPCSVPYSFITSTRGFPKAHEKYFVTWEYKNTVRPVRVILGGMNIGDMYLLGGTKNPQGEYKRVRFYESEGFIENDAFPMRDTDVELIGPATEDVVTRFIQACESELKNSNEHFQKDFCTHLELAVHELEAIQRRMHQELRKAFPKHAGTAFVRFIFKEARLYDNTKTETIPNFFSLMLNNVPSDSKLQFAAGYFLPTKLFWKSLIGAARRGVDFDILINKPRGPEKTIALIEGSAYSQIRHFVKIMPEDSVTFYEWCGNPSAGIGSVMHQKVYSFGLGEDDPCAIGSSNLNSLSLYWDSEDLLVIQSRDFKKQINAMFQQDFSSPNSEKITQEQLDEVPFLERLKEFTINKFFRDFM